MRLPHGVGWCHPSIPPILRINTLVLVAASVALQLSRRAVGRGLRWMAQIALTAGGGLSIAFLAGQVAGWQAVGPSLYFIQGSPAIAFFYVLTIAHGLHLIGGLYVLGRSAMR
jgi:cytochrome c oxidase subunit 3